MTLHMCGNLRALRDQLANVPAARIIATLQRDLDELPHHRGLVITSAGVMPPVATPETIKRVADFVHAYPARMG